MRGVFERCIVEVCKDNRVVEVMWNWNNIFEEEGKGVRRWSWSIVNRECIIEWLIELFRGRNWENKRIVKMSKWVGKSIRLIRRVIKRNRIY